MSDEKLTTLDGVDRRLSSEMLVIADAERPVALAGIMGGQDSEISTATTDVLIESAYFDPDSVRRTARRLGMDTEASRRFERGADCESVLRAQERCVELICEIAGGIATVDTVDVYPRPLLPVNIDFRPSRVQSLTSLQVKPAEMSRILAGLGFVQTGEREGAIMFVAPTWRVDIEREVDLVEEIARHSGYDKIASELPPSVMSGEYQPGELKLRRLRCILKCSGFDEAINFSFVETSHDEKFELIPEFSSGDGDSPVLITLQNPILEEFTRMRATLLPGLLASARHNFNQGIRDLRLFEIGRIFAGSGPGLLPRERESLALLVTGGAVEEDRAEAPRELDFYDLKGSLEAMADSLNLGLLRFDKAPIKHLKDGQAAKLSLSDGRFIGTLGTLSELVAATYKFRQPVYVAEIDLSSLLAAENKTVQYTPLPRYPSVIRDLTLLVARNVSLGQLIGFADAQGVDDYRGAKLVGTYEGPNIPEGRRSITIRVEYRSEDRTLRDEEVEVRQRQLIGSLFENFGAEVR